MCGIVAWFSKYGIEKSEILLAGINTQERGTDGAGIWTLEKGLSKTNKNFSENFNGFADKLPDNSKFGVLHNRWKTHGISALVNTHPFRSHGWVMVHNGTVTRFNDYYSAKDMQKWADKKRRGKTDSEELFYAILFYIIEEKVKVKIAVNRALDSFHGNYTVLLFNEERKVCYLFSNYSRYLIKKANRMWFFSEKSIADASIDTRKYKEVKIKDNVIYCIDLETVDIVGLGRLFNGSMGYTRCYSYVPRVSTAIKEKPLKKVYPSKRYKGQGQLW